MTRESRKQYQNGYYQRVTKPKRQEKSEIQLQELRKCLVCGKRFKPQTLHSKMCSLECRLNRRRSQLREFNARKTLEGRKARTETRKCKECGKEFTTYDGKQKFCSLDCRKFNTKKRLQENKHNY